MSGITLAKAIIDEFHKKADPSNQSAMENYMRNQFPFLGIKTPVRKATLQPLFKQYGKLTWEETVSAVDYLWRQNEREFQYAALTILEKQKKKLPASSIILIMELVTSKSWWDTVDHLASHMCGSYFSLHPHEIDAMTRSWINSDNMWVRRTAILSQLKFKEKTDEKLLFDLILQCRHEKEFFIQKAIGWALREYSKTNKSAVVDFIEHNDLPKLSKREGLKWLSNQGKIETSKLS